VRYFPSLLIDAGYRVLFTRAGEIVQKLQVARQSLQLPSALAKLDRFDLIILDDLSYVTIFSSYRCRW
jgi:DNA replication protein DnaC